MDYERPMTRIDSRTGTPYNTSAHFLWIGERTRDLDGAHVDFLSRVRNPHRREARPDDDARDDARARRQARPEPRARPPHVHHAHGRGQDPRRAAAAARGDQGDRTRRRCGSPTRCTATASRPPPATRRVASTTSSTRSRASSRRTALRARYPGGIHVELTGDDVTECLGGSEQIDEADPRDPLRVALRPAPEPHAVARARVPRRRGARRPLAGQRNGGAASRTCRAPDAPASGRTGGRIVPGVRWPTRRVSRPAARS